MLFSVNLSHLRNIIIKTGHNRFHVRSFPLLIKVNPSTILRYDVCIRIRKCDAVSQCGDADDVVVIKTITFCQARYELLRKTTDLSDVRCTINTVIAVKFCPHATKFGVEKESLTTALQ